MSLLADDECRVCFHVHPYGMCLDTAHDPGPDDTDIESVCRCHTYVDLEAQSRIVVTVDRAYKYWYFIYERFCPQCCGSQMERIRMTTPRPEKWEDRHSYQEAWDGCD